jgi:mRNA interferase MazF
MSHDAFNEAAGWRSIIVVPLSTSQVRAARGLTAVRVARGAAGLGRESVALCHQVTTPDRTKLSSQIGTLPRNVLGEVVAGLRAAMDLD